MERSQGFPVFVAVNKHQVENLLMVFYLIQFLLLRTSIKRLHSAGDVFGCEKLPDLSTCQAENTGDSVFLNFEKS